MLFSTITVPQRPELFNCLGFIIANTTVSDILFDYYCFVPPAPVLFSGLEFVFAKTLELLIRRFVVRRFRI